MILPFKSLLVGGLVGGSVVGVGVVVVVGVGVYVSTSHLAWSLSAR